MLCPSCGNSKNLKIVVQDEVLTYKGKSITLKDMKKVVCPCVEGVWDMESYSRYTEAQASLVHSVKFPKY